MESLGVGSFMLGFVWETGGGYHIYLIFGCFCAVVNCSFMTGT